ncbi:hypothetical protein [Daejeonella oryzae]|uniref:hypothetical protein n=1 Tax=Daejeonella oryzae TaxID=1122943 RepID=UPI000404CD5F|nr:hypothetical protein [Daejeonella oryzae]
MKNSTTVSKMNKPEKYFMALAVLLTSLFASITSFAQDVPEKVDVDINTDGGSVWYGQPWVWAVGVAIFIVIIVAITRGNSKNNG